MDIKKVKINITLFMSVHSSSILLESAPIDEEHYNNVEQYLNDKYSSKKLTHKELMQMTNKRYYSKNLKEQEN